MKNKKLFYLIKSFNKKQLIIKIICIIFLFICINVMNKSLNDINSNSKSITLVSAFYRLPSSKHLFQEYLEWIQNLFKLNAPIVFYTDQSMINIIKNIRPKKYINITVWIILEIKDFYSYKKYYKDFLETYKLDTEKSIHNPLLYIIWAEKCKFLENAILKNFFNSSCFYWIDAGYFRDSKNMKNYINWPSSKVCLKEPRVLFNLMRIVSKDEIEGLKMLNISVHRKYQEEINVGGGMFGGQTYFVLKFINLYYKTIKLFIKHNLFIGKDQNLFSFIGFLHPEIVKLIDSKMNWFLFHEYLSN